MRCIWYEGSGPQVASFCHEAFKAPGYECKGACVLRERQDALEWEIREHRAALWDASRFLLLLGCALFAIGGIGLGWFDVPTRFIAFVIVAGGGVVGATALFGMVVLAWSWWATRR